MTHGVEITEVPTGVKPPATVLAGVPVYFGCAPINLGDPTSVNKPVLCTSLADYEAAFGPIPPSSMWGQYTLGEAASAHFALFSIGPIVCVNILDPTNMAHVLTATNESHVLDSSGNATIEIYGDGPTYGVLLSTVVVKVSGATKMLGTDYTIAFDENGFLVVSRTTTGAIAALATITASYTYLNPAGVVASDIIGGYNAGTGKYTGIEVSEQVYAAARLVPGILLAPTWSQTPSIAARLAVKAHSLDGAFRCQAFVDLSTDPNVIAAPGAAASWKANNGFNALDMTVFWPLFKSGSDVYHLSTLAAALAGVTNAANNGVPYQSPSNQPLIGTASVLNDGTELLLTRPLANTLNDNGIVTALNGFNGWKLWGNRTAAYPGNTDVKENFLPIRMMFNWIESTIILTTDANVDGPINKRLAESIVGTVQSFLNSLVAQGALISGLIQFLATDNNTTDLSNGLITWDVTLCPPSPAETLNFKVQYDPSALAALFQ